MNLPPMPARIARRPRDHRGYPVPWFVEDPRTPEEIARGEWDFRITSGAKFVAAIKRRLCWVCGEPLGRSLAFLIGPMCAVNRVTSEPPSHLECALWSARACPFLSRPRMRRNEKDLPEDRKEQPGFALKRNPGGCVVWVTRGFRTFRPHGGGDGVLIELDPPTSLYWFVEGRVATREEVLGLLERGYPTLKEMAERESLMAVAACEEQYTRALREVVPA